MLIELLAIAIPVTGTFMFWVGLLVGRKAPRHTTGMLCRVGDGEREGRLVAIADDGSTMRLRAADSAAIEPKHKELL